MMDSLQSYKLLMVLWEKSWINQYTTKYTCFLMDMGGFTNISVVGCKNGISFEIKCSNVPKNSF